MSCEKFENLLGNFEILKHSHKARFILPANANAIRNLTHMAVFAAYVSQFNSANDLFGCCDVKYCIAFAFTGSMYQALGY